MEGPRDTETDALLCEWKRLHREFNEVIGKVEARYKDDWIRYATNPQNFQPSLTKEQAEDVVQDVLRGLLRSIETFNGQSGPQWLWACFKNEVRDFLAARTRRREDPFPDDGREPAGVAAGNNQQPENEIVAAGERDRVTAGLAWAFWRLSTDENAALITTPGRRGPEPRARRAAKQHLRHEFQLWYKREDDLTEDIAAVIDHD